MTPLDYYLWGAVTDKYYADKPETIDALKHNIREAIGEIQLIIIDNVLKNWTDREGYCMASRVCHLNEIIFHYEVHATKRMLIFVFLYATVVRNPIETGIVYKYTVQRAEATPDVI